MKIEIKKLYNETKAENSDLPIFLIWIKFIVTLLAYGFLISFLFFFALVVKSAYNSSIRETRKYPRDRYRKVVKEGLLWDTTEYHER